MLGLGSSGCPFGPERGERDRAGTLCLSPELSMGSGCAPSLLFRVSPERTGSCLLLQRFILGFEAFENTAEDQEGVGRLLDPVAGEGLGSGLPC